MTDEIQIISRKSTDCTARQKLEMIVSGLYFKCPVTQATHQNGCPLFFLKSTLSYDDFKQCINNMSLSDLESVCEIHNKCSNNKT